MIKVADGAETLASPSSKLALISVVLAAVQSDVQRFIHALRDVLLTIVWQMGEKRSDLRVPGGCMRMSLEGEIYLSFLRSLSRRQYIAAIHRTRADPRWCGTSAL